MLYGNFQEKKRKQTVEEIDCLAYAHDHNISVTDLEDCFKYKYLIVEDKKKKYLMDTVQKNLLQNTEYQMMK